MVSERFLDLPWTNPISKCCNFFGFRSCEFRFWGRDALFLKRSFPNSFQWFSVLIVTPSINIITRCQQKYQWLLSKLSQSSTQLILSVVIMIVDIVQWLCLVGAGGLSLVSHLIKRPRKWAFQKPIIFLSKSELTTPKNKKVTAFWNRMVHGRSRNRYSFLYDHKKKSLLCVEMYPTNASPRYLSAKLKHEIHSTELLARK